MQNYLSANRDHWNQRTDAHWGSDFYNVKAWLAGDDGNLKNIERNLLPAELTGLRLLHLQCHFGQDTLSLARLGAEVTGVDLSDRAIEKARELAQLANLRGRFINCDLYSLPEHLPEDGGFDIVFTTYGTIGWLPDLDRWAAIVSRYLKPGGQFIFAEFHPFIWTLNPERNGFDYSYFKGEAIVEETTGSYTDQSESVTGTEVSWNHGMAEVISALLKQGLQLDTLREFDYSPWNCFPNTVEVKPGQFHFAGLEGMLPITYALRMRKE